MLGSPRVVEFRHALAAAVLGLLLPFGPALGQTTYTWNSPTDGNFSDPARWQNGLPPPAGGGTGVRLVFNNSGTGAYTATNDLGNPFTANRLTFDTTSTGTLTVASAANNVLALGGAGAAVTLGGGGGERPGPAAGRQPADRRDRHRGVRHRHAH